MTRTVISLAALAALLAVPSAARADRRYYGETYTAATAPRGALDLELWSTFHRAPRDSGEPDVWRHQVELETGITDHWDVALYNIARQVEGKGLEYEAVKVETRYRLSDPGQWFVDPVLYLEVRKSVVDDRPLAVEGKLILAKDVGRLNLAVNAALERETAAGEVAWATDWAAGSSWEIVPWVRAGAEVFGAVENFTRSAAREETVWAGPALSFAVARSWLVLAAGFGLNDASEAVRARAVLAFQF